MRRNTNHHFHELISSQRKATSGAQKDIISLGKALVEELGLEEENDTLARWMAHYISEKIMHAESSEGDAKSDAEKACFDAILKLWKHRSVLPNGKRPFESFESVFRAIESFDPENENSRFFIKWEDDRKAPPRKCKKPDETKEWVYVAKAIDKAARALIQYSFKQAAIHAVDSKTKKWIHSKLDVDETKAIHLIIFTGQGKTNEEKELQVVQHNIDAVVSKIDMLDSLQRTGEVIRRALDLELQELLIQKASIEGEGARH